MKSIRNVISFARKTLQGDDIFLTDMFIIVRMKNKQTGAEDRMNQNEEKEMKIRIAKEEDAEALLSNLCALYRAHSYYI